MSIFLVTEPTQGWLLFGGGTAALKYMPNYYFVAVALWRADCIGQSFRDKELHSPKYILGAHSCEGKWALCPMVACRSIGGLDHYCKTRDYLKPCIPFMNSTKMFSLVTFVLVHTIRIEFLIIGITLILLFVSQSLKILSSFGLFSDTACQMSTPKVNILSLSVTNFIFRWQIIVF